MHFTLISECQYDSNASQEGHSITLFTQGLLDDSRHLEKTLEEHF